MLREFPKPDDPNLLVGFDFADDAGVYKLTDDLAIIQTIDVFTPIVDDAYDYGRIAAANSLSDVYAMGGKPLTCLNFAAFPRNTLDIEILGDILRGGFDKVQEAGAILLGGHTIEDKEPKYGMAVTGVIHPDKVVPNAGAKPGDRLILTKPLGTGIITTALKVEAASERAVKAATESMATLNKVASETMQEVGAHGCTDITGFGFIGHALEMAKASNVGLRISLSQIPLLPDVIDLLIDSEMTFFPVGSYRNRDAYQGDVDVAPGLQEERVYVLYDAQTSGGLLIAVAADQADHLLQLLHERSVTAAAIVGEAVDERAGRIIVSDQ